jgi:CheY-like chemotaxis protein
MKINPTIFIADDDVEDLDFIESALIERNANASCMTFANGLVLLNYLTLTAESFPDLIVLDINMPVKNGFLTLHELKQNPRLKGIPVIMLTASPRLEDDNDALQWVVMLI